MGNPSSETWQTCSEGLIESAKVNHLVNNLAVEGDAKLLKKEPCILVAAGCCVNGNVQALSKLVSRTTAEEYDIPAPSFQDKHRN